MPKRIPWRELAVACEADAAESFLGGLKCYDIVKCNTLVCTVCTDDLERHKMQYRLLKCSSTMCGEASEDGCVWRGKLLSGTTSGRVSIYDYGEHTTGLSSPKKKKLTARQKTYCREMAAHYLRPLRIRHALSRKFETPLEDLPALQVVQNFVNHYSRTSLENHDRADGIREWVHTRTFTGSEAADQAFTFGWRLDRDGKPVVGDGSDPFV